MVPAARLGHDDLKPSPDELHRLIAAIIREPGVFARCLCGAARFCPFTPSGTHAYEQFDQLHAGCVHTPV